MTQQKNDHYIPFTSKNFPYKGNEHIPYSGERTVYVPINKPNTNFIYSNGFNVGKNTEYLNNERLWKPIEKNSKIHFLPPSKLYTGNCLSIGKGIYAEFSTNSVHDEIRTGWIKISDVQKPSLNKQSRIEQGIETQRHIASEVQRKAAALGLSYTLTATARAGSNNPDLVVSLSNTAIQFEAKGTNGNSKLITFFDKSVCRGNVPKIIDDLALVFINNTENLKKNMTEKSYELSFTGVIDYYQKEIDSTIGFAGDPGVFNSGKMPDIFTSSNEEICKYTHEIILDHFKNNGDNYFVIHNRKLNTLTFYWTGYKENILKEKLLPFFEYFKLKTYGGKSSGKTRIGFNAMLKNEERDLNDDTTNR